MPRLLSISKRKSFPTYWRECTVPSYLEDMIEPGLFGLSRAMACGVDNFSAMNEVTLT